MAVNGATNFATGPNSGRRDRTLHFATGILGDNRKALKPGDPLYAMAEHAWEYQDEWSKEEHQSFQAALYAVWPTAPGRTVLRESEAFYAYVLRERGLPDEEIATALGLDMDSMRRQELFALGREVWRQHVEAPATGKVYGPPLPRVYSDDEPEPELTHVNLPIGVMGRADAEVATRQSLQDALRRTSKPVST